jgi:cytochrome c-type biogenesis protein CcmH/NrfG
LKRSVLVGYALALVPLLASPAGAAAYSDAGLDAYRIRNDLDGELTYARAWVAAEPSSALARRRLAEVYLQQQDTQNALASLQQAVRLAPNDARSWLILGNVYGWRKQYREAADALRHATRLEPANPLVWQSLSAMLAYAGDERGAVKALADGMGAAGSHFTSVDWYNYGNHFAVMQAPQQAIVAYKRAVAANAANAPAWNNLGTVYAALGQRADAQTAYRKAAALNDPLAKKNLDALGRNATPLFHNQDMLPARS